MAERDLGAKASYLNLERGMPVYARDGEEIARVAHVLAEPNVDIFDGIVLAHSRLPGSHRFVDAAHVDDVYERGVVLTIAISEADQLPEPTPGEEIDGPLDSELDRKLRRAWELISGR